MGAHSFFKHHTEQRRRLEGAKGVRMKTTGVLDMRLMEVALDRGRAGLSGQPPSPLAAREMVGRMGYGHWRG